VHHRLLTLHEALGQCSSRPANRMVVMVARVTPAFDVENLELPALDRGAVILGGRVRPIPDGLEIVTWNTGEASDLRRYGNRSHAEAQFFQAAGRQMAAPRTAIPNERKRAATEAASSVPLEVVWLRQHRAVICRAFIPAVLLARFVGRAAAFDRRLDPLAALAIWFGSHVGPPQAASETDMLALFAVDEGLTHRQPC
jgi:hypothetical protein